MPLFARAKEGEVGTEARGRPAQPALHEFNAQEIVEEIDG
jgi:hypothetical protein